MKKVLITQSNYIPWKGYFDAIRCVDELILFDDMQFTKRDWRNRNLIKTKTGLQWLTIPVEVKGRYFQKIKDTKISDSNWAQKHWTSICHNYSKARDFTKYKEIFEDAFLNNKFVYLSEINFNFISIINETIGIKTNIRWSSEFYLSDDKTGRLVDICEKTNATDYYTGPSARTYIDEKQFEKKNIKVHYFDYSGYLEYKQQYFPFEHGVSILDLIFNVGTEVELYLKTLKSYEK